MNPLNPLNPLFRISAVLIVAAIAVGDGGLLCVHEVAGPFRIAVFVAPSPPRVGTLDVSVLVQSAATQTSVLDADVVITARGAAGERAATATRSAATNKLLYAALIDAPVAGPWTLTAQVSASAGEGTAWCAIEVAPPLGAAWAYWPYLVLPAVVIALFGLHQYLSPQRHKATKAPGIDW